MKPRGGPDARLSVLDVLIVQRQLRWAGESFPAWLAEHRDEVEAGVQHYLDLGDPESLGLAATLRELSS